jgi:predicted phage terminase large subunit-like protein
MRAVRRAAGDALHPDREPLAVLADIRAMLGSRHFAAQYLQMPAPPEGNIINPGWFRRYTALPAEFDYKLQSWDTASKDTVSADYSVCVTIGVKDGHVYLLDVFRKKMEYFALKQAIYAHAMMHRPGIIVIEESPAGIALIQQLRAENLTGLRAEKPIKDKVVRIERHSARLEAGRMFVPADAVWLPDYLHEIAMFPNGKHDDQVDATSQALAYVWQLGGPEAFIAFMRANTAAKVDAEIPNIRIDHDDKGISFFLRDGRKAARDGDGSFLVTEAEYRSIRNIPGLRRL